jgi:hypothetical protein
MRSLFPLLAILSVLGFVCGKNTESGAPPSEPQEFPEFIPIGGLPENMEWNCTDGPDFYVYRATKDNHTGVGFYVGLHPDLEKKNEERRKKERSLVAGIPTQWIVLDTNSLNEAKYSREAIIQYSAGSAFLKVYIHLWIYSDSEEKIKELQSKLESLSFELTTYEERQRNCEQAALLNSRQLLYGCHS